jgi:hypothetical protein
METAQITDYAPAAPVENVTTSGYVPEASPSDAPPPPKAETAATPPDPKMELFSQKFAELQREKKALRERELKLKERESSLNGAPDEEYERFKKLKETKSPRQLLDLLGFDLQKFNETALSEADEPASVLEVKAKIKALEEEFKTKEQKLAEREAEQIQQSFKQHIKTELLANKDQFGPLLVGDAAMQEQNIQTVFEVMQLEFQNTGNQISVTEAATKVKDYLVNETKKYLSEPWIEQLAREAYFEKWGLAKPVQPTDNVNDLKSSPVVNTPSIDQKPKTITNAMSQSATTNDRDLSDEERRQKALNILMGSR